MTTGGTILVAGGVFARRHYGGHVWAFAQWVRGLRSLGHRVVFVDRWHEPGVPDDPAAAAALELLGGSDRVALLGPGGATVLGLSRARLVRAASEADLLVNVMGYLDDEEILGSVRRRAFLDIDPGFGQMWRALGLADVFAGHDAFVTVGSTLARSAVPLCGIDWVPTLPPVHLPDWPATPPVPEAPLTTVASWRGPFGPLEYEGIVYGLRAHEFRRFVDLPVRTGRRFEVALDLDESDGHDRAALHAAGWTILAPDDVAATPDDYRRFVQSSAAELMIAKHLYVATRGGWFSDRSACYLASGRPVLAQDTGFSDVLPCGDGLLSFTTPDEAAAAVADLYRRYAEHCDAARAIAEEHFASDVVLSRLLETVLSGRGG